MSKLAKPFEQTSFKVAQIDEASNYGKFVIEPLERGYGLTLGNSLRRVLLASLPGASGLPLDFPFSDSYEQECGSPTGISHKVGYLCTHSAVFVYTKWGICVCYP